MKAKIVAVVLVATFSWACVMKVPVPLVELKARGYYELHFPPTGTGQPDLARQMLRDPARAVRYALENHYKSQKPTPSAEQMALFLGAAKS